MYIDAIRIERFSSFAQVSLAFLHPAQDVARHGLPVVRHPNLNLLVGGNSSGKTTLLKAIALAGLGPAVDNVDFPLPSLTRREPQRSTGERARRVGGPAPKAAVIAASFLADEPGPRAQARSLAPATIQSQVVVERRGTSERLRWQPAEPGTTRTSPAPAVRGAGLLLGYGATRGLGGPATVRRSAPTPGGAPRPDQVRGLFEDAHALTPLSAWLPPLRRAQPGRFAEVARILNRLLAPSHCTLTEETAQGECVFTQAGVKLPLPALSDGCRALLAWLGDLLHHLCLACPPRRKLVAHPGLVLVDEVDLHLHPQWQMQLLPTLARTLPKLQFVLTTHSPLLVGSVEWANLIAMQSGPRGGRVAVRLGEPVHGLDADQLLLTGYFGLESTRAPDKQRRLHDLTWRARTGDAQAAKQLLEALSRGEEAGR